MGLFARDDGNTPGTNARRAIHARFHEPYKSDKGVEAVSDPDGPTGPPQPGSARQK